MDCSINIMYNLEMRKWVCWVKEVSKGWTITSILKRVGLLLYNVQLILCKILFFVQFGPQSFLLSDQDLFKEELISNSYERVGLKEGGLKWKI